MGGLPNLDDLEAEWAEFMFDRPGRRAAWSQDQRWRNDNPGKLGLLLAYRAGGARPDFSASGRGSTELRMLEHLDAWLEAKAEPAPPPVQAHDLPTRIVTVPAGSTAYWLVHDSPTTQIVAGGGSRDKHRVLRWAPDGFYAAGKRTFALLGFNLRAGIPGRAFDWHTQPDAIGGWTPPGNPAGVAPVAVDYWGNTRGLHLVAQAQDVDGAPMHFTILSQQEMEARRNRWTWVWLEIVWGRRPSGAFRAWLAGEDTPRVNVSGIHTHYQDQNQVTYWEGAYDSTLMDARCDIEIAATRFGRTPQECYEDRPVLYVAEPAGVAGGSSVVAPARQSTEAAIPAPLRW